VNTLTWIGVGMMAFGAGLGGFAYIIRLLQPARMGVFWADPADSLGAVAKIVRAVTGLLRTPYGFPALVFMGGLVLVILGQVRK
jgi:hypothetical protein